MPATSRSLPALRDIDFRRSTDNAARVLVELPNPQVPVDIRSQGKQLIVEFLRTSLPEGLRRRLDVSDFGTPVSTITTTAVGDRVRMVIEPRGPWETSAYQSDNQFVIELRSPRTESGRLSSGTGYGGEKITLDFQSIELRNLLQVFADYANVNVVVAESVAGTLTLRLKDVPWDQALDIILDAKGLKMRKSGNVLWIAPKEEAEARERRERDEGNARLNDEPVRTQAFQLNYARARTVAEQLLAGTPNSRVLSPRGSAIAEERTNQLFITDTPARLEQVQALITRLDVPVRQVLIEARIVEAADTFGKSLGVRLGGSDQGASPGLRGPGSNRWAVGGTYGGLAGANGELGVALDPANTNFVNLPAVGQGGFGASSFAISLFNAGANRFLNLELSALEADGKGKLVSSPRIVTADKTKALIEQGTEFPYQQATASGATAVAFRRATLKLEVTPNITPEGNIILDLDVSKDSRGETTAAGIAINTKHIRTQVLVENGGTVVIGGIFELTETENEARVPVLGELPGVGALFRNRQRTSNKQEMLVFITPKMITDRAAER
jgi:type IV pilus assembly protein PilQ